MESFVIFEGKCPHKTELDVDKNPYHKVTSSDTSRLEAHTGFFKLLMKGIFDPYVL